MSNFQSIVSARKNKRCTLDGHAYTLDEFTAYYGEATKEIWESAPHFIQLQEFCDFFKLSVRSGLGPAPFPDSSCALFGLWVPACLVLVDVHHLEGKLKVSRLTPEKWKTDIWKDAWKIGYTDKRMMVLDLCTELLVGGDPLGMKGRKEMNDILKEFCQIMDGELVDEECLNKNHLMRFLSVSCGAATPPPPT